MPHFICTACGMQYAETSAAPKQCDICEEERQYVPPRGQTWTTLQALRKSHRNSFVEHAPDILGFASEPHFAIGQQALLVRTNAGNVLWDCIATLDAATVTLIKSLGGIQAIAISHPHFYTTMGAWSTAFDDAPISLSRANEPWVMHPTPAIHYFDGESVEPLPGVTVVRCGGHFPGSSALVWPDAEGGAGALFTGDTISVCADPRWLTFMYSFPNQIPLDEGAVHGIVHAVEPFAFDRIYGGWSATPTGAKAALTRSADRYIAHLRGASSTN